MDMETLWQDWDGEEVIIRFDRITGAWIIIAIHSTRLGSAAGGTRMKPYTDLQAAVRDALNLARGMTYKFAMAEHPLGGGKAVIAISPDFEPRHRRDLLLRYGALVHQLGGLYLVGPDVGTTPKDMDIIHETGAPYVFARTEQAGGAGGSGPATALGVFCGIEASWAEVAGTESLHGVRVLVQGTGSVGGPLIHMLREAGAEVAFSEVQADAIRHYRDELGLPLVPEDKVYDTACEIFTPCALGGILNEATIPRLRCRVVAGAANNQLASLDDAERLRSRGILYAPDFAINSGGALAIHGMEALGWSRTFAYTRVKSVKQTLRMIFQIAKAEGITTETAAVRIAEERLAAA